MVVTSVLAALMVALLLYGHLPAPALAAVCLAIPVATAVLSKRGHHHQHDLLGLDVLAHGSRLASWNAGLKTCLCVALVIACVAADSLLLAAILLVGASAVSLWSSRVGFARYCRLMTVPILFVALSGIVLLVDVSPEPSTGLSLPAFGWYLCVTPETQAATLVVVAKAVGSLACLYALALSTPVYEITGFLRRLHVPAVVTDLVILTYCYVSILAQSLRQMTTAAHARLGTRSYRAAYRSFTGIGSNLLVRSFFRASRSFDAMEARGCTDELRFDIRERPFTTAQVAAVIGCAVLVAAVLVCERMWL